MSDDDDKGSLKTTTEDFDDEAAAQAALQVEEARYNQLKVRQGQRDTAQRQSRASKIVHEGSPLTVQKRRADVEAVVGHRNLVVLFRDYSAGLGSKDAFERHQEIEGGYREWNVQIRGSRKGAQITDDFQRALVSALGSAFVPLGAGIYFKRYVMPAPVFGDIREIQVAIKQPTIPVPLPATLGLLIVSERSFEETAAGYGALLAASQYWAFTSDLLLAYTIVIPPAATGLAYSRAFDYPVPCENRDNEVDNQASGLPLPGYTTKTAFKQSRFYVYLILNSPVTVPTTQKIDIKLTPREVV